MKLYQWKFLKLDFHQTLLIVLVQYLGKEHAVHRGFVLGHSGIGINESFTIILGVNIQVLEVIVIYTISTQFCTSYSEYTGK